VKVGDFVRFTTDHQYETDIGLLISIEDNPADLLRTYPAVSVRKIGRVLSNGIMRIAWLEHIHHEPDPVGRHNESR
jgi:hypothetical protein